MLRLQHVTYAHPNKDVLLDDLSLVVNQHDKIALAGNNGAGKSTLLQLMAGILLPRSGTIRADSPPYYVPQVFGQYNDRTVAGALQADGRLRALYAILGGQATEANFALLDDDWGIEERCRAALAQWGLDDCSLDRKMGTLSGGQQTRVFLAGIAVHRPGLVLLDEPSNHLDAASRALLYDYLQTTSDTLMVVSHDRTLLNLLPVVYELSKKGLTAYGGNYDFYAAQKALEAQALQDELRSREKALRKARETAREATERQQKLDARGRRKQEDAGLPTISLNTLRNKAEQSTAKMKDVHAGKTEALARELGELRRALPGQDRMKMGLDDAALHRGKVLVDAQAVNVAYEGRGLWAEPQSFLLTSGQRLAIRGDNGSGKTTLIRLMLGLLQPSEGTLIRAAMHALYIDQDYSLLDNGRTVFEQAERFNTAHLEAHEVKSLLTRFLFTRDWWDKPCAVLSGGERMRLMLCCLTIGPEAPDLIVLDEPTNNLDLRNIEILTAAIRDYRGTLVVVSHDAYFLEEVGVTEELVLA